MKNLAIIFVGAVVLSGCGSVRYPKTYVLNLPPPVPQEAPTGGTLGTISVREFQCPEYLCEGRIVYRSTPEEVGFYEYHRWALNPREAITQYVVESLRARSLFKSVVDHEHGSAEAYVLSGKLERLEELDHGPDVRVICTISAQLLDARTKSIIWSHTASDTIGVENRDMGGVVSSFSVAAWTATDRLLKSLSDEVPAAMAVAGRTTVSEAAGTNTQAR